MQESSGEKQISKPVGRYRELRGSHKWYFRGVTAFAAILSFMHVFKIVFFGYVMPDMSYFAVLIAAFVSAVFLLFPATDKAPRDRIPWYDAMMAAASLIGPIYVIFYNMDIILGGWEVVPPFSAKIVAFRSVGGDPGVVRGRCDVGLPRNEWP